MATAGRILKGSDVKLEGQFHLDIAQDETAKAGPKDKNAVLATPQAHIVEKHPEFAVIQVTCSCGKQTYLKCEYLSAPASGSSQTQNGSSGISDQTM